jgi:flagellar basal body-associated protein FliL
MSEEDNKKGKMKILILIGITLVVIAGIAATITTFGGSA